ncbi:C-type lectin domain family 2 member B-like [Channa argus]|uniref:C-type lectin domain family 2 member B-like n=1 Tax=Channa argus TaxID=215402 RepID=UPI003522D621
MEAEPNYSTLVFKNDGRPKEKNEDSTIYSTVKVEKAPANTAPNAETPAHSQHLRQLGVCFGVLCVLLLVSISVIIYLSVEQKTNFEATINNLMAEKQQLITNGSMLQTERDNLTRMLGIIIKFDTFPVKVYCPQKKCQPCPTGWIQFQQKCYLFYDKDPPWKTWQQSQEICQNTAADLVVIDNLQEQEFVSNNTKYYYDKDHGYWLGLNQTAGKKWVWVDGHNDTLGFWIVKTLGNIGPCALMIPATNFTANWNPTYCAMENKFICEIEALIW